MDSALKAEWYDVDDADREHFLDWLHGAYLPELQARPGHIWVGHYATAKKPERAVSGIPQRVQTDDPGVAGGKDYVLLTAAASADVFFDPNAEAADDAAALAELAKRRAYRSAVFIEETRVSGPEYRRHLPGSGAPPAMQIGGYRTRSEADDVQLSLWYRQLKLPQVTVAPGCIGARKMVAVTGWPRHGILYEFISMEDDEANFEARFRAASRDENWQGLHVLDFVIHAPNAPHAGRRIWPRV